MTKPARFALFTLLLIPINPLIFLSAIITRLSPIAISLFAACAIAQLVLGIMTIRVGRGRTGIVVSGVIAALGALVGGVAGGFLLLVGAGGGPGRPLRLRGRQRHAKLRAGNDWCDGPRPEIAALDFATRRALHALWLRDAQIEHASVPAFARVSWLLVAAGAPPELVAWSHRAALEEIAHARACFALAAGYAGRELTVEPLPALLDVRLDSGEDPRVTLAVESVIDGCHGEAFNADLAIACASSCGDSVTREALARIAREERSHADFSWAVLDWLLASARELVAQPIADALAALDQAPRPTSASPDQQALIEQADEAALREHGRLPDSVWRELWNRRITKTRLRVQEKLRSPCRVGPPRHIDPCPTTHAPS